MVVGAVAVAAWGRPRATADIDVTVLADEAGLERIADAAVSLGLQLDHQWLEWNPLLRGTQIRLVGAGVMVDVMGPRDGHDVSAIERRRGLAIEGHRLVAPAISRMSSVSWRPSARCWTRPTWPSGLIGWALPTNWLTCFTRSVDRDRLAVLFGTGQW